MRRTPFVLLVAVSVVALSVGMTSSVFAQMQRGGQGGRGGPGGRGGFGDMYFLERAWTIVTFQVPLEDEQWNSLYTTFGEALQARTDAMTAAMQTEDRQARMTAIMQAMNQCKQTLTAKLTEVLTDEQLAKFNELINVGMGFGGQRPGGQGGPGGPGGQGGNG